MTYLQLLNYVSAKTKEYGVRMDAAVLADRKDVIGYRMVEWCEKTRCMYRNVVDLDTNGDPGPFSFSDTTIFAIGGTPAAMVDIKEVFIGGKRIREIGAMNASVEGLRDTGAITGEIYWYRVGEDQFQFIPAPGATPVVGVVSGPIQHKAITSGDWNDATNLELPLKMHREFADFVIEELLSTAPEGEAGQRYLELRARNDEIIAAYRDKYDDHPSVMNVPRRSHTVSIGRTF